MSATNFGVSRRHNHGAEEAPQREKTMTASKPRSGLAARLAATVAATVLFVSGAVAQEPVEITFWTWLPNIRT